MQNARAEPAWAKSDRTTHLGCPSSPLMWSVTVTVTKPIPTKDGRGRQR
jgi:hypothetical protein